VRVNPDAQIRSPQVLPRPGPRFPVAFTEVRGTGLAEITFFSAASNLALLIFLPMILRPPIGGYCQMCLPFVNRSRYQPSHQ